MYDTMAWPSTWAAPDERMLQCALWAMATTHFARAAGDRAAVGTPGAWTRRRDELLATLRQMIGPFPERTPFKARVTGRLDKERYAIEKVLFESRPHFYVTASLYLPRTAGRAEG